jgi:hypothetical protein
MDVTPLRSLWAHASLHDRSVYCHGFKEWLSSGDFFLDSFQEKGGFELSIRDKNRWKSAMASDSIRYGINALQSVHSIRASDQFPKLGAWPIIQAYYSAFFAAHSILRLFGRPFSYLEPGHANDICLRAKTELSCVKPKLPSGSYFGKFDQNLQKIEFVHKKKSHEHLWAGFADLLNDISKRVLLVRGLEKNLAEVSIELSEIIQLLNQNGRFPNGNWLSVVRNNINYKASEHSWFPFSKNTVSSRELFDSLSTLRNGSFAADDCKGRRTEEERVIATCLLIVNLSNELLTDYVLISAEKCRYAILFRKFSNQAKGSFEI